jgi:type IV pilus assembly protein PilB
MIKSQKKLGEILMAKGLITDEQLKEALDEQRKTNEFLGKILLKNNQLKEKDLLEALAEQFNIPYVSLKYKYIDWQIAKQFSLGLILDYKCFPIAKDEWSVTVAITNPLDVWAIKKAEEEARGLKLKLVLVSEGDMKEVIQRYQQYLRSNIFKIFNK